MKKKLLTIGVLALCMCLLSSCGALSLLGVDTSIVPHSDGPTGAKPGATAVDDNMVMISKEQYERYQMFDGVLELMAHH